MLESDICPWKTEKLQQDKGFEECGGGAQFIQLIRVVGVDLIVKGGLSKELNEVKE